MKQALNCRRSITYVATRDSTIVNFILKAGGVEVDWT